MLAFIDESGHPHPNDRSTRPVVVSVCIEEKDCKDISRQLCNLKRRLTLRPDLEMKANKLLTRGTFRRRPDKREFVEAFFELCRNLPFVLFAVIMERPTHQPAPNPSILPNQFRYLLQRVDLLLEGRQDFGIVLFDGSQSGDLPLRFSSYLYKSFEGQTLSKITDAPFFVDSRITPGIQIADMAASAIRQYQEAGLFHGIPQGDAYLSAIARYYRLLEQKTLNQETPEKEPRYGFYRMSERDHYREEYQEEQEESPARL